MKKGVKSPDSDYPELKIPEELVPEWLKPLPSKTSVGKWEHVLVNDMPKELDDYIRKVAKHFNIKYRYADEAMVDWFQIAVNHWDEGRIDSSMWHLSRACHLIQDITVPMHCRISGNLADVWQVLHHEEPNHEKFEKYCTNNFQVGNVDTKEIALNENFKLPDKAQELAGKSRKILKYCDGIGPGCVMNFPPFSFLPWFVEDYDKAMNISCTRGEVYTVKLIHYFFQTVKMK
jgi:hypothetical protein